MEKGYIHIYTGEGKGKTTAALGLALRAACAGKKVYMGQFVKGMKYSEVKAEEYLPNFRIEQLGRSCFIDRVPEQEDIDAAQNGLKKCSDILSKGEYDVVILDEVNIALYFKLFLVEDVIEMLKQKSPHVEVVLTGRYAPKELIEIADLVTEMKEIKHYYTKGVMARKGIEN
ncbi:cob(I)yrinic acid a,c-diamide adenosyltransferase [Paramaledivibacter caminithermalis]|jgi:cob(I)alamin adenosyltransferase|uniref:Cob(I)alamin adenosyltransferase n=1 Tax=Paramaledivibacter caminithermalis (strain DSM 15212 / CIP 107654 / DViRD3) TaxID=1121301 RepID=A0A1M6KQB8_PARC5|nr:cob(I)yrinic acid a,c-diamide adenosyltransferase [Paramaledivibacter caminithermalis]SHJ61096.1 cob(I)alamin adenosyltransferase [Paramaledivibacter caminithermalis DSM 15212]